MRPLILCKTIRAEVCHYFELTEEEFMSDRRDRVVARPRQVAMYLARKMTKRSTIDIGKRFGNRHHSTVLHALRSVDKLLVEDDEITEAVWILTKRIARRAQDYHHERSE